MKKKKRLSMALITLVGAALLILVLSKYKRLFYPSDLAFAEGMDELREKSQAGMDATMQRINAENALLDSVVTLIRENKPDLADKILDSAINANPQFIYRTYKGMVYAARGNDSAAIEQYNESMKEHGEFPLALYHRSQSYLKQNNFDSAIADLKKAADINYDFCVHLAKAYEQNKMIDSAIVYYKIYLDRSPEKTAVQARLDSLATTKK